MVKHTSGSPGNDYRGDYSVTTVESHAVTIPPVIVPIRLRIHTSYIVGIQIVRKGTKICSPARSCLSNTDDALDHTVIGHEVEANHISIGTGRVRRKANSRHGCRTFDGFLYFHKLGSN